MAVIGTQAVAIQLGGMLGTDPTTHTPEHMMGTDPRTYTPQILHQGADSFLLYTPGNNLAQADAETGEDVGKILAQSFAEWLAQLDAEEIEEVGSILAQAADEPSSQPSQLAQAATGIQAQEFWTCTFTGKCETAVGGAGHAAGMTGLKAALSAALASF